MVKVLPHQSAMYFSPMKNYKMIFYFPILILAFSCLLFSKNTAADEIKEHSIILTPNRCIALHQGQICYQTININWSTNRISDYCLYRKNTEQAIYCWNSSQQGQWHYEFASSSTETLQLIDTKENILIDETTIEVAWVYKANTRRKTHWRVF